MSKNKIELSEPLRVICINPKGSVKLIKGAIYEANSLITHQNKKRVYLNNVGNYDAINFVLEDSYKNLSNEPDFITQYKRNYLDVNKNYIGQFVKCRYSNSKYLKTDEIYYVEDQKIITTMGYNHTPHYNLRLKIRGIKNYISYYSFYEIPIKEQRNIKLKNLHGIKTKTGEETRKFLLYTEKEKITILTELFYKVITDINNIESKNKINFLDLMLTKGKRYHIISEDLTDFFKRMKPLLKPYKDIIEL